MASKPSRKELSALQKAQDIVYAAWEKSSETRRLALAGKAVEVSPLCCMLEISIPISLPS
jgi:hypothetical protein